MNRTWKLLCWPALLTLAVTVSPVRADPEVPATETKEILKLLRQMQQSNEKQQRLNELRDEVLQQELTVMKNQLTELEQRLDKLGRGRVSNYPAEPQTPLTPEQLRELSARIDRLERGRISSSFTPSDTITPPALTGSVRIQNRSIAGGTVAVNGSLYVVSGGETITIPNLPAGTIFTYEVLQDARGAYHAPRSRVVPVNEAFVIYLNP